MSVALELQVRVHDMIRNTEKTLRATLTEALAANFKELTDQVDDLLNPIIGPSTLTKPAPVAPRSQKSSNFLFFFLQNLLISCDQHSIPSGLAQSWRLTQKKVQLSRKPHVHRLLPAKKRVEGYVKSHSYD